MNADAASACFYVGASNRFQFVRNIGLPCSISAPEPSLLEEGKGRVQCHEVSTFDMNRSIAVGTALTLFALAATALFLLSPSPKRFGPAEERFSRWEERQIDRAERAIDAGDHPTAIDRYRALASRHPASAYLHGRLGAALRAGGKHEQALAEFETARRLAPADENAAANVIMSLDELGRRDEAVREAVALASPPGASARALTLAGTLLANNDRPEEAVPLLRRAVHLDGRNDLAWHELGFAHTQLEDGDAAEQAFQRALALSPCDLATLHAAAWNALVVLDDDDRALAYAEKAITCPARRASEKADFFYLRADLKLQRDDAEGAVESLRSALKAGYDGKEWCEPGSPFVLALADRPDFQALLKECKE